MCISTSKSFADGRGDCRIVNRIVISYNVQKPLCGGGWGGGGGGWGGEGECRREDDLCSGDDGFYFGDLGGGVDDANTVEVVLFFFLFFSFLFFSFLFFS